jgi:hypothetical protein
MASIQRATLPQNFLDSVSTGMRLPQPEPEYTFAKLAMAARLSLGAIDAGATTVQQFVSMQGAGASVPPTLDQLARLADTYPNAVVAVDDFGKGQGDTIKMRRPVFEGGGYDLASRQVIPDKATSVTGQAIKGEEVPIVLHEYEGPFSVANSAVNPYAIRDFDAKYKANKDSLADLVTMHLRRDYVKWLDAVVRDLMRGSTTITYADDVANVLSFTNGAGHGSSLDMIMKARKALSDREWSKFPNGRYLLVVPTSFNVQMVGDPDYRALSAQHTADRNLLFGYITSIQDVDIVESTTLKTYVAGETVPGDGNTVPTSATVYESLLIGPGSVGVGTAMAPTAFWADDTDFGKSAKVVWRSIQAFAGLDIRGVQRVLFQA